MVCSTIVSLLAHTQQRVTMKNYIIIAAVSVAFLKSVSPAYAGQGANPLAGALDLAIWAAAEPAIYSESTPRDCSADGSAKVNSSARDGAPANTGYCTHYDCSSFVTWVMRQIPGQPVVQNAPNDPPNTYALWTGNPNFPDNTQIGPNAPYPRGWKSCNPASDSVCIGFTEWGEAYPGVSNPQGPGHVVISLGGAVYQASSIEGHVVQESPPEGSGESQVVWVKPATGW